MKAIAIFTLALMVAGFIRIQPVYGEPDLTLTQALSLAQKNNLEFQASQKEVAALEGDLIQAGLHPNPALDLESKTSPFLGFHEGERDLFLSQELETGGKRPARIRLSQSTLEEAKFRLQDKARQLRQQVRTTFFNAWISGERVSILQELLNNQDRFLNLNEARVKLGAIPSLEAKLIKAEEIRVRQKLEQAQTEEKRAFVNLSRILGLSLNEKPVLQIPDRTVEPVPDLTGLLQQALANRPDLKAQRKNVERAEAQIASEKAQAVSNVTVGGGLVWDRLFVTGDEIIPRGAISQIDHRDTLYEIRLSLPLPLFNRNQGNILKAERLRESALIGEKNITRLIEAEVTNAWQTAFTDQKVHKRFEHELLPVVRENAEAVQKAYQLGGESILVVMQAQQTWLNAELDYLDNLRDLEESIAALESASGVELP